MLDPELGYHPDNPRRTGPPSFGWDGEQGPFIAGNEVNFASLVRSDYVSHAFSDRTFSGAKIGRRRQRRADPPHGRACGSASVAPRGLEGSRSHETMADPRREPGPAPPPRRPGSPGRATATNSWCRKASPSRRLPTRGGCCGPPELVTSVTFRSGRELGDVRGGTVRVLGSTRAGRDRCRRGGRRSRGLRRRHRLRAARVSGRCCWNGEAAERPLCGDDRPEESVGPEAQPCCEPSGPTCAAPATPFAGIATGHRMALFGGGAARAGFHLRRSTLDPALRRRRPRPGRELRLGVEVLGLENAAVTFPAAHDRWPRRRTVSG